MSALHERMCAAPKMIFIHVILRIQTGAPYEQFEFVHLFPRLYRVLDQGPGACNMACKRRRQNVLLVLAFLFADTSNVQSLADLAY